MAESSAPWTHGGGGDASISPYDAPTEWAAYWRSLSGAGGIATNLGGVFSGELNELAVLAPGAISPATVNTGRALAYGTWYENSASVNVAIATPGAATRIDRIVLRKDWAAQTVRITRIAGAEGGAAPALTQTPGVTWDTPLAQASITTGGVVTVTDERQFIGRYLVPPVALVTAVQIANTSASTYLVNTTLVAPFSWTNRRIRVTLEGDFLYNNSTADRLLLAFAFNTITLIQTDKVPAVGLSATRRAFKLVCEAQILTPTSGLTGSQLFLVSDATAPTIGVGNFLSGAAADTASRVATNSVASGAPVVPGATPAVQVFAKWSAASVNNDLIMQSAIIEVL